VSEPHDRPIQPQEEVARAYYASVLGAGDAARTRAQVSFTVASAIATALIAGGAFAKIGERPVALQIVALIALALWMVTAYCLFRAVGQPVAPDGRSGMTQSQFFDAVMDNAARDRDAVQSRQQLAHRTAAAAFLATFIALLGFLVDSRDSSFHGDPATISLSSDGHRRAAAVCPGLKNPLAASIDTDSLEKRSVELRIRDCGGRAASLVLPARDVRVVAHRGP
jgi:hypothetical protein